MANHSEFTLDEKLKLVDERVRYYFVRGNDIFIAKIYVALAGANIKHNQIVPILSPSKKESNRSLKKCLKLYRQSPDFNSKINFCVAEVGEVLMKSKRNFCITRL